LHAAALGRGHARARGQLHTPRVHYTATHRGCTLRGVDFGEIAGGLQPEVTVITCVAEDGLKGLVAPSLGLLGECEGSGST
jgi:hypothetical protein